MNRGALLCALLSAASAFEAGGLEKIKVDASTPESAIIMMDPARVDASPLPLTTVEGFHATGTTRAVNPSTCRLTVSGKGITASLSLTHEQLLGFPMVRKPFLLICPAFFYDCLVWEGVPLQALLDAAGAQEDARVVFTSVDGYSNNFKKEEVQNGLVMVARKGNGAVMPKDHGFPGAALTVSGPLGRC
jgi:DMSO/TMAO reductase YedYZ molybdopterin-dependent catalytic subunit